jgi:hypothetical protein
MVVTAETKIPDLPLATEILSKPSKEVYDRKLRDFEKKADELKLILEENRYKKRQVFEGGKVDGENVTYREVITENIEEVKKFRSDRRKNIEQL